MFSGIVLQRFRSTKIRGAVARNTTENDRQFFSCRISNQGLDNNYDPPRDGNCQFSALCHQLTQIGIFRSAKTLREALVVYLRTHPDGFPLQLSVGLPWDEYVKSMASDGTDLWRSLDVTSRCKLLTSLDSRVLNSTLPLQQLRYYDYFFVG